MALRTWRSKTWKQQSVLMKNNVGAFIAACAGMFLFGVTLITLGSVATDLKSKFDLDGVEAGTLFSILPFGILAVLAGCGGGGNDGEADGNQSDC